MAGSSLDHVVIWARPDGTYSITKFQVNAVLPGQTEADFIRQEIDKLKVFSPDYANARIIHDTNGSYRAFVQSAGVANKRKIRIRADNTFFVDNTVELPAEKTARLRNTIRAKLIAGTALSPEEADAVLRNL